jgi:hypothetical protein
MLLLVNAYGRAPSGLTWTRMHPGIPAGTLTCGETHG